MVPSKPTLQEPTIALVAIDHQMAAMNLNRKKLHRRCISRWWF
jgi:hypothetical protein